MSPKNIEKIDDSVKVIEAFDPGAAVFRCHLRIYRKICGKVEEVALAIFSHYIQPPFSFSIAQARKITVIDYSYTAFLRVLNKAGLATLKEEDVKTLKQKEREQQIAQFQQILGKETIYPQFSKVTADYVYSVIPKIVAEKMTTLPLFFEGLALFRLGIAIRYINYQTEKRIQHRCALITSVFGKQIQGNYNGLKSRVAHFLLGRHNLEPLISFEHLFLNICVNLNTVSKQNDLSYYLMKTSVRSLGKSLNHQFKIHTFLTNCALESKEARFIARLEWHRRAGCLPRGIPDPEKISLTPSNLSDELDKALAERIKELIEKLLVNVAPESLKKGFLGTLYWLEGKDFLVQVLGHLISEFGIKQLVDPHLFALAILYASGEDIADYELDGFGINQTKTVVSIGQEILNEALKPHANWESIQKIFIQSNVKASPGGFEALTQKNEAKKRLHQFISQLLYQMLKGDDLHYDSLLKGVRERASQLPVVGIATISLHGLINGMFFSFGYLFREKKQENISFLSWMAKKFSGKGGCDFLARRIVALIYHPSWRITLMQLIDDLTAVINDPPSLSISQKASYSDINFKPIIQFLFQHFIEESNIPFKGNINPLIDYFSCEGLNVKFQQLLKPSNDSVLEKALTALLPTIKELMLHCRLVESFRKQCVAFNDDQKFWEIFLRESLNRLTQNRSREENRSRNRLSLEKISAIRNQYVEKLLEMNQEELRTFLLKIPADSEILHQWEVLPKEEHTVTIDHQKPEIIPNYY